MKVLYPSLILRVRSWCISQCHESQDSSSGSRSLMSFLVALCTWTLPSKTQGDHYRSFSNIEGATTLKTEIRISIVYGWIEDQWCPPSKDHLPKIRDQYFMAPFFRALSHYNMSRKMGKNQGVLSENSKMLFYANVFCRRVQVLTDLNSHHKQTLKK